MYNIKRKTVSLMGSYKSDVSLITTNTLRNLWKMEKVISLTFLKTFGSNGHLWQHGTDLNKK